jgi:hypothetical protein
MACHSPRAGGHVLPLIKPGGASYRAVSASPADNSSRTFS